MFSVKSFLDVGLDGYKNKLHKHSHLFSMIFLHCKNTKTSGAEWVVVKSVLLFFDSALCIFIFSFLRVKSEHDEEEMTLSSFQENNTALQTNIAGSWSDYKLRNSDYAWLCQTE